MSAEDWLPTAVPTELADQLVARLGQPVAAGRPVQGGFASNFAAVLTLADLSNVFVKASADPDRRADYRVEASIGAHLPSGLHTPKLRGWLGHDPWTVLWFEVVEGTLAAQPWVSTAVDAVLDAHLHRAGLVTPCPVPGLRTIPDMMADTNAYTVWGDLLAGRPRALTVGDLDPWVRDHLRPLADWEARWPDAVRGEALCHFDPRADSYLIDKAGVAWVVDWSRGCVGARWVDLVTFAATLAADGYDAEHIVHSSGVAGGADPEDIDAHLAVLAGYWSNAIRQPRAERPESVLDYQRRSAAGALAWLRQRTGPTS